MLPHTILSAVVVALFLRSNVQMARLTRQLAQSVPATSSCPVTPLKEADSPAYYNDDRTMSIIDTRGWRTGDIGVKVHWIRPRGTTLSVTGHRLDGDNSESLKATVPCCYSSYFQASRLYFPSRGCWEIMAKAGTSELRFVIDIRGD